MPDSVLPRNRLSFLDKVRIFFVLLRTPIVLFWTTLKWPFSSYARAHGLKRLLLDRAINHVLGGLSRHQTRTFFGSTRGVYDTFMKKQNLPEDVEDVGEGAKLLWVGPKNTERVILYFHGGGFLFRALASAPALWWHVKNELAKRGKDTGVGILEYTLVPDRAFPAQLKQALRAIQRVLDSGIEPANIVLCGDSAGALLIHQIFSHILHPIDDVPKLEISSPFGAALMVSPWTRLVDKSGNSSSTLAAHDLGVDMLSSTTLNAWGTHVREGVPHAALPYLEVNEAPEDWLQGLDRCVRRILITAGGAEILRDDIIKYSGVVERHLKDTTTVIHDNGVHLDPYLDFLVGIKDGQLTPIIIDFLDKGFTVPPS